MSGVGICACACAVRRSQECIHHLDRLIYHLELVSHPISSDAKIISPSPRGLPTVIPFPEAQHSWPSSPRRPTR